jgi:glycosyltransferase involved in cell wall biosynthesis
VRICLYTETALPKMGGQEMVVDALARQFQQLGHDPLVFVQNPRRPLRPEDGSLPYPVRRHPRHISTVWFVSWYQRHLQKLYREWPFDVLHCHGIYPPAWLAALSKKVVPVPVVITSHGGDVYEQNVRLAKPAIKQRVQEALAHADSLVAISRFTKEGFLRLCPQPKQLVTIPNGVDRTAYVQPVERPSGLADDIVAGNYAVFLGRMVARKGIDVLLRAWPQLPQRTPGVDLVLMGDGEEKVPLQQLAAQLGISSRVRFLGKTLGPTKTFVLQSARCVVVPSIRWEAFGLIVLEAFSAGVPVVASRLPGLEDLVSPGHTGELVEPGCESSLAGALERMMSNPEKSREMGAKGRAFSTNYDWRSIARQHLELYTELIAKRRDRKAA